MNNNKPGVKALAFDLETSPYTAMTWGTFNQYIAPNQILKNRSILCASWSWIDPKDFSFTEPVNISVADFPKKFRKDPYDDSEVVAVMNEVLTEADVYIYHNGDKFDIKVYNTSALCNDLDPLPYKPSIDTLKILRRRFAFPTNKLDYVAQRLGIGGKIETGGMALWEETAINANPEAAHHLSIYCNNDVEILSQLYFRIRAWDHKHPAFNLISGEGDACPTCTETGYLKTNPANITSNADLIALPTRPSSEGRRWW